MALWGQGEDRWIVKNLKDGTNVNSWHWDDINIKSQFQSDLSTILKQYDIENLDYKLVLINILELDGDISIVNRKNKLKLNYNFSLKIEALLVNDCDEVNITIDIPEIFDLEPDIYISNLNLNMNKDNLLIKIQEIIGDFIENYKLEKKNVMVEPTNHPFIFNKTIKMNLPPHILFKMFIEQDTIRKYRDNHTITIDTTNKDSTFNFINVTGKILNIETNKKIVFDWNMNDINHHSQVILHFEPNGLDTKLKIEQTNIMDDIEHIIENKWLDEWIIPICRYNNCNYILC